MVHTAINWRTPWEKINEKREKLSQKREKTPPYIEKPSEFAHDIVVDCNFNINYIFSTTFFSWKDSWILDEIMSVEIDGLEFHRF